MRARVGLVDAAPPRERLRAALERIVQAGIDALDAMDAAEAELEDDEREIFAEDER